MSGETESCCDSRCVCMCVYMCVCMCVYVCACVFVGCLSARDLVGVGFGTGSGGGVFDVAACLFRVDSEIFHDSKRKVFLTSGGDVLVGDSCGLCLR